MIFVFAGDKFLPEYSDDFDDKIRDLERNDPAKFARLGGWHIKYSDDARSIIRSGREKTIVDDDAG
jgi:hypothetical protein